MVWLSIVCVCARARVCGGGANGFAERNAAGHDVGGGCEGNGAPCVNVCVFEVCVVASGE